MIKIFPGKQKRHTHFEKQHHVEQEIEQNMVLQGHNCVEQKPNRDTEGYTIPRPFLPLPERIMNDKN